MTQGLEDVGADNSAVLRKKPVFAGRASLGNFPSYAGNVFQVMMNPLLTILFLKRMTVLVVVRLKQTASQRFAVDQEE